MKLPDIDIDTSDRTALLDGLKFISAKLKDGRKHPSGIYVQNIPHDLEDMSTLTYEEAEQIGYFKLDILNNSTYQGLTPEQVDRYAEQEPDWSLFEVKEIVDELPHVNGYHELLGRLKPTSIEQLAQILAIIRPAKRHLINKGWDEISPTVWIRDGDEYYFKRSHALAFALSIIVKLNALADSANQLD